MPAEAYTIAMPLSLTTGEGDGGRRLDRVLRKALPDMPLSAIHRLLRQGHVLVNGEAAFADFRIQPGQVITLSDMASVPLKAPNAKARRREDPGLEILFEGEGLIFLNKPAGLQVHGRHSLEELVRSYLVPKLPPSLSFKPGPLHRLDRPTSGVIAFSSGINGARFFSALLRERKIKKQYIAIVEGVIEKAETWQEELVRDSRRKKTFTPDSVKAEAQFRAAKTAITRVTPLMKSKRATLILAEIETGITHQIRAQAASRGHPLLGDIKYGGGSPQGGPAAAGHGGAFLLHAWRMEFPENARDCFPALPLLIEAPLPENFQGKILKLFGQNFSDGRNS